MEGQGRSRMVMDGLFPSRLPFQVRKVMGGGGVVACRIIVSALVPVPLDLGFGTWIWDWT